MTAAAAAHLGLPAGVPVAQGGADAFVGMLGLGVVSPNQLALITGSSHLLLGLATERFHGEGLFGTYADALLPGTHVVEGGQTSTGSVVNWFKKLLGSPEVWRTWPCSFLPPQGAMCCGLYLEPRQLPCAVDTPRLNIGAHSDITNLSPNPTNMTGFL